MDDFPQEYLEGYRDGLDSADEAVSALVIECNHYRSALSIIAKMWLYTEAGNVAISSLQPYQGVTLH